MSAGPGTLELAWGGMLPCFYRERYPTIKHTNVLSNVVLCLAIFAARKLYILFICGFFLWC